MVHLTKRSDEFPLTYFHMLFLIYSLSNLVQVAQGVGEIGSILHEAPLNRWGKRVLSRMPANIIPS